MVCCTKPYPAHSISKSVSWDAGDQSFCEAIIFFLTNTVQENTTYRRPISYFFQNGANDRPEVKGSIKTKIYYASD